MDSEEQDIAYRRLWAAAMARYAMDARAGLATGRAPDSCEAVEDLRNSQRILRRLCGFCDLDPESTAQAILRYSVTDSGKLKAAA